MGVVTIKDIAKACGVSRGSVDRALHNRGHINEETKNMILKTAKQLGYQPNYIARSLVKGKTNTIGVVLFDVYNEFFCDILNAIDIEARNKGYLVTLMITNKNKKIERENVENLINHKVDGLILCSVNNESDYIRWLKQLKTPMLTLANRIDPELMYIGIDEQLAIKEAVRTIYKKKYKRIIYVSPPLAYKEVSNIYAQQKRYDGFCESIKELDLESIVITDRKYLQVLSNINLKEKKTAILCSSDIFAINILDYFKKTKLKVPKDIGLMGFDNINLLKYIEPRLATVNYPKKQIGEKAAKILIKMIENNQEIENKNIKLEHYIIQGKSLG